MLVNITKRWAKGTNLRTMTIKVDDEEYTLRISEKLYKKLVKKGVITSQKNEGKI